jgi:hypothetical protein
VTHDYQQFYEHWRDSSAGSSFLDTFPYKLSFGADPDGIAFLPVGPNTISRNQILVTRSYDDIFHRLLRLRSDDLGYCRGAVLTMQPGVGVPS